MQRYHIFIYRDSSGSDAAAGLHTSSPSFKLCIAQDCATRLIASVAFFVHTISLSLDALMKAASFPLAPS